MSAEPSIPSKYSPEPVEQAVLVIVIDLYPICLTLAELLLKIAGDPNDRREIETITRAVCDLRESGVLQNGDDERIEPTLATLRFVSLLLD